MLPTSSIHAEIDCGFSNGANFELANFRFWYPDQAQKVSGIVVLVPGSNADGRSEVDDPVWQSFAQKHHFGLIGCFFKDREDQIPSRKFAEDYTHASEGSGEDLLNAIRSFAIKSEHPEIDSAPLLLWGHSAGGQFNYEFTCWKPERVVAFVVNKGGSYYTHFASPETQKVPGIFFTGENDLKFRIMSLNGIYAMNRRAGALWTLAPEPAEAHDVGHTRELSIDFFETVIPLRLPESADQQLKPVSENSGYVGDLQTYVIRQGAMKEDEWCTWLPSETFSNQWKTFVSPKEGFCKQVTT